MPFFEYRHLTVSEMQGKTVSGMKINRIFERVAPCSRNNGYFKEVCTLAMYALGAIRCLWLGRSCFILRYVQILPFETLKDALESTMKNSIGKPYEGKLHVRFDEGGTDFILICIFV